MEDVEVEAAGKRAACNSVARFQAVTSSPANMSFRAHRGPEAGGRGIPSPFINLDERGRDTPYPSLLPLWRGKTFLTRYQALANELLFGLHTQRQYDTDSHE